MGKRPPQTNLPLVQIELDQLVRACAQLGAAKHGGPLSEVEAAVVARAMAKSPAVPRARLAELRADINKGGDPLGEWFLRIRSPLERRPLGAFYTQPVMVDAMVEWTAERKPARVVDAGCGSGRFAAAIHRALPRSEIVAVDTDPIATLCTRALLAVLGHKKARVLQEDYTRLELSAMRGKTAFIGNPPYVRHHDLPPSLKDWAKAEGKAHGLKVSALAGLHAYFYLATARISQPGDIGCLVTSAEWLDVGYGSLIRELLAGPLGATSLQVMSAEAIAFDDAMTTASIACFEVGGSHKSMHMRKATSSAELAPLVRGRRVSRERLEESKRWSELLRGKRKTRADDTALRDVARVHRGVVTGSNQFFVMTRERARELGIAGHCRPVLTSAKQILGAGGVIRKGPETKVILDLSSDLDPGEHPDLARYLELGEEMGVDSGYVASHRSPWWRIGISAPPPIVASYMARQPPVFALNPDGLVLLNIAHGIYPTRKMSKRALAKLVGALNDNRDSYRGAGRTYHGGLEKFEPKEMEALPIPAACLA
ncbi:MAG: methyltransferase [Deltaproteobacteria bacterium]|nr:methyltransferase [Deltaproteobacteria bacterium]